MANQTKTKKVIKAMAGVMAYACAIVAFFLLMSEPAEGGIFDNAQGLIVSKLIGFLVGYVSYRLMKYIYG